MTPCPGRFPDTLAPGRCCPDTLTQIVGVGVPVTADQLYGLLARAIRNLDVLEDIEDVAESRG